MVARQFIVRHDDDDHHIEHDTDDGFEVLQSQIFSLTLVPPDQQKILANVNDAAINADSDLAAVSDRLVLVSVQDQREISISDEELARLLQAEEEAVYLQQFQASGNRREFENRVRTYVPQVFLYEDPMRQEAARKTVPVDEIEEKSLIFLAKETSGHQTMKKAMPSYWSYSLGSKNLSGGTSGMGMGVPLPSEIQYGGSRVELYWCNKCSKETRFPRYNDPIKLLETRRGRCGEWANCFTLYCRTFGYSSRLILDFTDHVWTECYSHLLGRWMHLDPCEGEYDKPLLYEKGWNKKLNYVIAISKEGVYDVTKRYTRNWHKVIRRRNITTEADISAVLSDITSECRRSFSREITSTLKIRDERETEELETNVHIPVGDSLSLPGRQSGSKEWRMARAELGSSDQNNSEQRHKDEYVDSHVTRIHAAFSHLTSRISKEGVKAIKKLLEDLRASPFRERTAVLESQGIPHLGDLLEAISLKGSVRPDGRVSVGLAGDPVLTSLALPVALDVVEKIINKGGNSD
ncbi:peptide-N-glycanase 1 isoform X2 [Wolffia australiana]